MANSSEKIIKIYRDKELRYEVSTDSKVIFFSSGLNDTIAKRTLFLYNTTNSPVIIAEITAYPARVIQAPATITPYGVSPLMLERDVDDGQEFRIMFAISAEKVEN